MMKIITKIKYVLIAVALTLFGVNVLSADSKPVTVVNTPSVEVVNEVPVTIENIPMVDVRNTLTIAPPLLHPVMFSFFGKFDTGDVHLIHRFQIEPGKTFLVEQISNACSSNGALGSLVVGRTDVSGRKYAALWLSFEETNLIRFRDHVYSTHAVGLLSP